MQDLGSLTVMVVDDSAGMRQLMGSVLQSLGIRHVRAAASGPEALTMARQAKPDLFIVDWEMRPMDGLTLMREIRRVTNYAFAFVPIIVLTAHSSPQVVRAALSHGANQFLSKPVVPQTLLNRMLWALNDRRAFVNRDGFFVHAGKDQAPSAVPAQPAQAAKVPKPTEMWEIE
jgi:CheY-like chemotaxis protein